MVLGILTLFIAATVPMVKSECIHLNPSTVDFEGLCEEWWNKAHEHETSFNIKRCVNLIAEKCPKFLNIAPSTEKEYDEDTRNSELWTTLVVATLKSDSDSYVRYYESERKPICTVEDEKEACNYWWSVAKMVGPENEAKEKCISRILHYCINMITMISETKTDKVQRLWRTYDVITVVYEKTGDSSNTATFNRYVPVHN